MSNKAGAKDQEAYMFVKDALRYRWIRAHGCPYAETDDAWTSPEALDAAVDRDMAFERMTPDEQKAEIDRRMGWNKD